jgi:hypothetical protein
MPSLLLACGSHEATDVLTTDLTESLPHSDGFTIWIIHVAVLTGLGFDTTLTAPGVACEVAHECFMFVATFTDEFDPHFGGPFGARGGQPTLFKLATVFFYTLSCLLFCLSVGFGVSFHTIR